jgi:hypothetical protein
MVKRIIVEVAITAGERRTKKNQESQVGKRVDTRKKPHVICVALKVCSLVS